jgi:hypothetical protein
MIPIIAFLGYDGVGGGGPPKGARMGVVVFNVGVDALDQILDVAKSESPLLHVATAQIEAVWTMARFFTDSIRHGTTCSVLRHEADRVERC